jgi:tol-pal system protein YbgF
MFEKIFKMKKSLIGFVSLSVMAVTVTGFVDHALAQSTSQRLTAIEKQLNALQRQLFTPGSRFQSGENSNNSTSPAAMNVPTGSEGALIADINIRISELETQLRQMTGQLEEANFKIQNLTGQLEAMQKDNEFRFNEIEGRGTPIGGGVPATTTAAGGATALPPIVSATQMNTAKQKYDYAYGLVSNAQYDQAEISFRDFLSEYPEDELAGNAQYWLGQTFYARGNYDDATRTFLEGLNKYRESSKAPAYLLKVGMSLNLLGEKTAACEVYRELNSLYPDSSENRRLRPAEERKAGCS